MGKTLIEKILSDHTAVELDDRRRLIYVDRIFLHERTGSIALQSLHESGRTVARPKQVFCTMDHIVDTFPGRGDETLMPSGTQFIRATREAARQAGITLFDVRDEKQGIAHVVAAEQGIALPGLTMVCPDSHTCTLGGLGCLAWGIGSTEAEHALATRTLELRTAKTMRVTFDGELCPGVTAKDMILHLIAHYGANGGAGYVVEFAGSAIRALEVEQRMTLCNMAVEFSAVTGLVAPDDKTIDYVRGRPYAPRGEQWKQAVNYWQTLRSDSDAVFDREIRINARGIAPSVSWGINPEQTIAIDERIPSPDGGSERQTYMQRALDYMALEAGAPLAGTPIDAVFIGSCTNSRLSDLRAVAAFLEGKKVAPGIDAVCVPGSTQVKRAAEAEGIHIILKAAGFEWRESGCSMCFYAGGETFGAGKRVLSTTNRNFQNRQGPGVRTHIASPLTVAASAVAGVISDPREVSSMPAIRENHR
ncbi:3-isopropylmalate dehydratase large subunit [Litorivivens lipolytica]|nr:3-isopropylmalate dehydratase large subunit [Litorivivens lipolytica]